MTVETEPGAADPNGPTDPPGLPLALERQLMSVAVAQLPAEYRAVLRGSFYEGRTTKQIANDLQIADSTVKARLHFAVRALRSSLQSPSAYALCREPPATGNPTRCGIAS
jgi:RNA polymerase sigma-70 factor, ECF subfamily